jgi:hypothetical protein
MLRRAAVNGIGRTGDKRGLVGNQKGDQKRRFLGLCDARDRPGSRRHRREPQFLHRDLEHRRVHRTRTYRVAADSLSGALKDSLLSELRAPSRRGFARCDGRAKMRDDVLSEQLDRVHGCFVWDRPELHHGHKVIELRRLL